METKMSNLKKNFCRSSVDPILSKEYAKKILIRANKPQPQNCESQYLLFLDIAGINISSKLKVSTALRILF
jgi:hypothetical protein